ncbi:lysoplasmalogenase TMEM86A-like isoform X1 [Liolophura sinensis]|uniref:lysoplasmalogenase TMEM86A-like isoform X1 n=2 Tax=Liolophura sinensis TaxID=3198878 RepID=UPI0031590F3E
MALNTDTRNLGNGMPERYFISAMDRVLHSSKTLTFVVMTMVYFAVCKPFVQYPPHTLEAGLLKMLPIWSLAVYVLPPNKAFSDLSVGQQRIVFGLLISSLGDLCLIWRETLFIPGLLWFSVAHVCYLCAFWSQASQPVKGAQSHSLPMYIVAAVGTSAYILQTVPGIIMPYLVIFYSVLLFAVSWRATVCFEYYRSGKSLAGCLGTVSFLISDSIIGIDKWVTPIPYAEGLIMSTYYLAQYGIAVSAT